MVLQGHRSAKVQVELVHGSDESQEHEVHQPGMQPRRVRLLHATYDASAKAVGVTADNVYAWQQSGLCYLQQGLLQRR